MKRDEDSKKPKPADRVEKESFLERVKEKIHERATEGRPLSGDEFLDKSGRERAARDRSEWTRDTEPSEPAVARSPQTGRQNPADSPGNDVQAEARMKTAGVEAGGIRATGSTIGSSATSAASARLVKEAVPPQAAMPITQPPDRREPGAEAHAERPEREAREGSIPAGDEEGPLFIPEEAEDLRERWNLAQSLFVDDPRSAVHQADALIECCIARFTELLKEEHQNLERQLNRSQPQCTTDQLRQLLRRYHSFLERMLSL
jgi:hypothetical protein